MTAKEMFEKLGYMQKIKNNVIYYFKEYKKDISTISFHHINFILEDKELYTSKNLTHNELQAINKQVEELGWNK